MEKVIELHSFLNNQIPIHETIKVYYIVISDSVYLPLENEMRIKEFIKKLHDKNKKVVLSIRGDKSFWSRFVKVRDREIKDFVLNVDNYIKFNEFDGIEFYWKGLTIFNYKKWKYFTKFLNDHYKFTKKRVYF